ncbi:MAG: TerB family tellurite resistance protein [Ignavibacterium sp.]|jgi:uncharacterized tellurite resistance protein B-like protein|nr:MAG: TerB family tellurite resistance protein [Ignavibacterium sp.]MDX9712501.1 TerB family tellurite resistance protein [Ignavibacteriaceae bacterium]MEB2355905.1 TerB family tellurite resistance protein [Ignavibacteriales bacterium]GIK21818.1 MAG: hypothetical protein BroJett005_12320 [Ignavibacteriota bacterium]MCZ7609193.1 TerB family tellurite resistance protein [Ignavibacterium sp.]
MFDYLKKIFNEEQNNSLAEQKASEKSNRKTEIAACALFIELAKADGEFSEDERKLIISEMKKTFNLDDDCINDLITLAEQKIKESVSLYEFTTIINNKFTQQEKIELIESLWRLIYTDQKLSTYEDHLIKIISSTMNIEHKQLINSKLWVKQQLGIN